MSHPLRGAALASLLAITLIVFIPDEATRYALTGAWALWCAWIAYKTYAKRPLLSAQQRRIMMAYHIDRGLELARDDTERQMLLVWVSAMLETNQDAS